MKNFLNTLFPIAPLAAQEQQDIKHKVIFLNNVFSFAGVVAFGMGFVRWRESAAMGMIDFGFAGLALALLLYLRRHREKVAHVASIALALATFLFFAIYVLAPYNTTRSSLFLLLAASAFFLKGRKAGLLCLLTMGVYLIAQFFIFDRYETVKEEQKEHLRHLNVQLEEKVQARTSELQQANQRLEQLNEELDRKVRERTQQLLAAQEELVRKEKLAVLGQVAGSVGHELRNPLSVISNAVYFLQTMLTEQLGRLFQPLFTTKARGIGLGLVVVKNLTEANGGSIAVQSEPGMGSTFTVTLPCGTKEDGHAA